MSFFNVEGRSIIKPVLIGVTIAVLVIGVLICALALTVLMMPTVPYGWLDYITIAIEGFGVLTGAYIAGVLFKSKGLIIGALCGAIILLITFAVGLSISRNSIGILTVIRSIVLMICGIIGGILGVNRKEKIRIK